jgi:hypothetical protein
MRWARASRRRRRGNPGASSSATSMSSSAWAKSTVGWSFVPMGASALTRQHRRRPSSRLRQTSMRGNPILNSLRTAEAAGYPALLIVIAVCLGLVVGPVALLGLTDAGWVLGLALLYLIVAIVVLSVAVGAALSEGDEPDAEGQAPGSGASDEPNASERPSSAGRRLGTSAGIGGPGGRSRPSRSLGARRRPSAVPAAVADAPAAGAARWSAPEGRPGVTAAESGADSPERGAATSLPSTGPRLDARRPRRLIRRTPGRRRPHRN